MPLRPFPYQLSIGTDLVHVSRIQAILKKAEEDPQHLHRFLRRVFTPREQHAFAARFGSPEHVLKNDMGVASKHLAGRWAAKEATIKAVSWRRLSLHDVVIVNTANGGALTAAILDKTSSRYGPGDQTRRDDEARLLSNEAESINLCSKPQDVVCRSSEHSTLSKDLAKRPDETDRASLLRAEDDADLRHRGHVDPAKDSKSVEERFSDLSGQIAKISISHDGDYATAVCLAAEDPAEGDVGGEATAREPFHSA